MSVSTALKIWDGKPVAKSTFMSHFLSASSSEAVSKTGWQTKYKSTRFMSHLLLFRRFTGTSSSTLVLRTWLPSSQPLISVFEEEQLRVSFIYPVAAVRVLFVVTCLFVLSFYFVTKRKNSQTCSFGPILGWLRTLLSANSDWSKCRFYVDWKFHMFSDDKTAEDWVGVLQFGWKHSNHRFYTETSLISVFGFQIAAFNL